MTATETLPISFFPSAYIQPNLNFFLLIERQHFRHRRRSFLMAKIRFVSHRNIWGDKFAALFGRKTEVFFQDWMRDFAWEMYLTPDESFARLILSLELEAIKARGSLV